MELAYHDFYFCTAYYNAAFYDNQMVHSIRMPH